jgi:mRNA-degrading endonuclease RelE of RelBE toxin-antitoxin system
VPVGRPPEVTGVRTDPSGDDEDERYRLVVAPSARRQVTEQLPEAVAAAAFEFIVGPLLREPHRVGKRLRPPLDDRWSARRGTYRVLYRIDDSRRSVTVLGVFPRSDAYRTR